MTVAADRTGALALEGLRNRSMWQYAETLFWIAYRTPEDAVNGADQAAHLSPGDAGIYAGLLAALDEAAEPLPQRALTNALETGAVEAWGIPYPRKAGRERIAPDLWEDLQLQGGEDSLRTTAIAFPKIAMLVEMGDPLEGCWLDVKFKRESVLHAFPDLSRTPSLQPAAAAQGEEEESPIWEAQLVDPPEEAKSWARRPVNRAAAAAFVLRFHLARPEEFEPTQTAMARAMRLIFLMNGWKPATAGSFRTYVQMPPLPDL